jgi:hypothetical protein
MFIGYQVSGLTYEVRLLQAFRVVKTTVDVSNRDPHARRMAHSQCEEARLADLYESVNDLPDLPPEDKERLTALHASWNKDS